MTKILGRLESIGIAKEAVRGTALAAAYWVPWMDVKIDDKIENVTNETSLARLENSDGQMLVGKHGEIEWTTKLKDKHIGLLLLSLFGTDTPAAQGAPNAAVYDHVFTVGQTSQHQSLCVSHKSANDAVGYANAVVDSIKISAKHGDYVYYTVKLLSAPSASLANTVAHAQESADFVAQNLTFKKATAQSGLDAASAIVIREFTIEIKQNCMIEQVLGNAAPNDILNKGFEVSGSVTLIHNDATFATMQTAETYNALRFDLTSAVVIATSSNPRLKIDLHRARISNYERKMKLNDIVEESFDFTGHYSLTDSKMITATLSNLVASY